MKLSIVLAASLAAVANAQDTIVNTVAADPNLSTLAGVVTDSAYAGVLSALQGLTDATLFAPNNAAFSALGVDCLDGNQATIDLCTQVLLYHVHTDASFYSADLPAATTTYIGTPNADANLLGVNTRSGVVVENGIGADGNLASASVDTTTSGTTFDVNCTNGVIHTIDSVMLPPPSVSQTAVNAGAATLVSALQSAGLVETLDTTADLTVFAPTEAAFAAIPWLDRIDAENLDRLLKYHVVPARAFSSGLTNSDVATLNGNTLNINVDSGVVINGNSNVVAPFDGITKTNGAFHSVDAVLVPNDFVSPPERTIFENMAEIDDLSSLVGLLNTTAYSAVKDALNAAGTLTLFAPNNDAIATLLNSIDCTQTANVDECIAILQLHLLSSTVLSTDLAVGNNLVPTNLANGTFATVPAMEFQYINVQSNGTAVNIGASNVVREDVDCSNGVIHVVDTVIPLPELTSATASGAGLSELVNAVVAADLVAAVDETPGITVFAPANAAFEAISDITACLTDGSLGAILQYHVLPTRAWSTGLSNGTVTTLQGADLTVSVNLDGSVTLTDTQGQVSTVTATDIITKNGVVHLIDTVVLPVAAEDVRNSLYDVVAGQAELSTLAAVVDLPAYSAIKDVLTNIEASSDFTLFAPNNDAFTALGQVIDCTDTADQQIVATCTATLLMHVLGERKTGADFSEGSNFEDTSLSGANSEANLPDTDFMLINVEKDAQGAINIGAASVTGSVDTACNGIIHVIDAVIPVPALTSEVATDAGLTSLVNAVVSQGLADTINGENGGLEGITVFAPGNLAFADIEEYTRCLGDGLSPVLTYHVLDSRVLSTGIPDGDTVLTTVNGASITINKAGDGTVTITDASGSVSTVTATDIFTNNGVVHTVNTVLRPSQLQACSIYGVVSNSAAHTALTSVLNLPQYSAIKDILDTDGNMQTLFAPDDDALAGVDCDANDCSDILTYHLLNATVLSTDLSDGTNIAETFTSIDLDNTTSVTQVINVMKSSEGVTIAFGEDSLGENGTATVNAADLKTSGDAGVVHSIDTLLTLPTSTSDTAAAAGLDDLVSNVVAAGLVSAVNGAELTVFAPIDAAFEDVDTAISCLAIEVISEVLQYHIVAGRTWSTDLPTGDLTVPTLAGGEITITKGASGVTVTDEQGGVSAVAIADVITNNAAVHVVDAVLLPEDFVACGSASMTSASVLSVALLAALSVLFA